MSESKSLQAELQSVLTGAFGDRYQLSDQLGVGSYGVVFRARDTVLERDVAIKQVRLDNFQTAAQAEEVKLRTQREAKMAAKLRHVGIVAVHDIVHTGSSTLIIMEYVDGKTLEDTLRDRHRMSLEQTIEVIAQTADALDHAHKQGVVHRDIKPANLMITDEGSVKIADFGIAKSQSGSEMTSNITATGNVLGTPYYMAPEQARGEDALDGRSDLFSLGCVTYECLAGRKPFRGKSVIDVLLNIVNGQPAELDCDELDLHPDLELVLGKALAKSSSDRFQSAAELVEALRAIPAVEPSGTAPVVTSREPGAPSSFDEALQGSLTERGIADIIRDVQTNGKTGILHLKRDELSKRLYFLDGAIVFANSDVESDRFGQFLISGGVIDEPSYERAARAMVKTRRRLGRTLVALGNLREERLEEMLGDQIQRIIYSMFSWDSGEYKFESIEKPVEDDLARALATDEIVLEGIRSNATESTIRNAIGDTDRVLHHVEDVAAGEKNIALTSSEGFILSRVDGNTSVADIASISPLDEDETFRCIYGLISAGLLRLDEPKSKETGRLQPVREAEDEAEAEAEAKQTGARATVDEPSRDCDDAIVAEVEAKRDAMETATLYEILDVKRGDAPNVIKKSYYTLAKRFHPDRHHGCDEAVKDRLEEILTKLAEAYDVLSDPPKRLRYDSELQQTHAADPELVGTVQTSPTILAESKYRAGKGCFDASDYHQAVQNLREAVRLDPSKMAYHKLLGLALNKNPKWRKQAETHLRRVIDAEPYDKDCYLALATIYEEGGLATRARKMYEQVASLDPEHEVALEKLGFEGEAGKTAFFGRFIGKTDNASH